jgi:short-subunit dehydrogenase
MNQSTTAAGVKNYALITGATSGIGFELARHAAADGYNLVLVARTEDRLKSIASEIKELFDVTVYTIAKDLFRPGAAKEVYDATESEGLIIDVLINNAGQGEWGAFTETDLNREIDLIHLNVIALISLTKYYLKGMVARRHGRILNLASSLAKAPTPLMSVYAATKAFVLSFSEALVEELKNTGVTVTALQPYATDTDFFHKAKAELTDIYKTGTLSDPHVVAKAGYEGMLDGSVTVMPGLINKVQGAMNNLTPDTIIAANLHNMMKPSTKIDGRTKITHAPSAAARTEINAESGQVNGDYSQHSGHVHETGGGEEEKKPRR